MKGPNIAGCRGRQRPRGRVRVRATSSAVRGIRPDRRCREELPV